MGEIRVKVILTNSTDEALHRRRKLKKSDIRRFETDAVVDTGAVRSVIPVYVMEKLGVMTRGQRVAEYADGRKESVGLRACLRCGRRGLHESQTQPLEQ